MAARSILFIDSRVRDYQKLLLGIPEDTEVFLLAPDLDGISQMADYLSGHTGYDSIQILSHGNSGALYLGATMLDSSNLTAYAAPLARLGQALTETGDILLYGCNVAQDEEGQAFIRQLATITGADVAASTDLTGLAALGGDWVLEASTGSVESAGLDGAGLADPVLNIADDVMVITSGTVFSLQFYDTNLGDSLTFTATLANGDPLPGWLAFEPATLTFSGTPGNGDVGALDIHITASNNSVVTEYDTFLLTVIDAADAPSSTGSSPEGGATGVAIDNDIVLNFSGAIQLGTGDIVLRDGAGTITEIYNVASGGNLSISGSTLTINPTADLASSTCSVELAAGSIEALSGNSNYVGTISYNFTAQSPLARTMVGGDGDDFYVVAHPGDQIFELGNGIDTISAKASYALPDNVERLMLTGTALVHGSRGGFFSGHKKTLIDLALNGTGNDANNILTGNRAANRLSGGDGNDILAGGSGNDILNGGSGSDEIKGGTGADVLDGGTGSDRFIFYQGDSPAVSYNNGVYTFTGGGADVIAGSGMAVSGPDGDRIEFRGNTQGTPGPNPMAIPTNGQVTDQKYFLVCGNYNPRTNAFTTDQIAGTDTLIVYDSNVSLGTGQAGIVISGIQAGQFTLSGHRIYLSPLTADNGTYHLPAASLTPFVLTIGSDSGVAEDGISNVTTPTIQFTAEASSTLAIDLGSGSFVAAGSGTGSLQTFTVPAYTTDGTYIVRLRATDVIGNSTIQTTSYTLDTHAPAAPASLALTAGSDSGVAGDNITNVDTPILTGTAEIDAMVTLMEGATVLGITTVTTNGTWSITSSELGDGAHYLTAIQADMAGNVSEASAPLNVTIQTAMTSGTPEIYIWDTLISSSDMANGVWIAVDLTATNAQVENTVEVLLDGNPFAKPVNHILSVWEIVNGYTYLVVDSGAGWGEDGAKSLSARIIDAAGNIGESSATTSIILDTFSLAGAPTNPLAVAAAADGISDDDMALGITVNVDLTGTNAKDGDSLELLLNGNSFAWPGVVHSLTSDEIINDHAVVIIPGGSGWGANGEKILSARIIDEAGNFGEAGGDFSLTVQDIVAPKAPEIYPWGDTAISSSEKANDVVIEVNLAETNSQAGDTVEILLDDNPFTTPVTQTLQSWDISSGYAYLSINSEAGWGEDGAKSLSARITDTSGNIGEASVTLNLVLDTVAPDAPTSALVATTGADGNLTVDAVADGISDAEMAAGVWTQINLSGTNALVGDTVEILLNGDQFPTPLTYTLGDWEISNGYAYLTVNNSLDWGGNGEKTLSARIIDRAGNVSEAGGFLTVSTQDTTPPGAPGIYLWDTTINASDKANGVWVQVNLADTHAQAGDTIEVLLDGNPFATPVTYSLSDWEINDDYAYLAVNSEAGWGEDGAKSLSVRITDASGNVGEASLPTSLTLDTVVLGAPTNPLVVAAAADGLSEAEIAAGVEVNVDLTGTHARAGDHVELFLDGDFFGEPHSLLSNEIIDGHVLLTIPGGAVWGANGEKILSAMISDGAGNFGEAGGFLSVSVEDITPPGAPNITIGDTAISSNDKTNGVQVQVTLAGTNAQAGDTVEVLLDGNPFATPITSTLGDWNISNGYTSLTVNSDAGWGEDGTKSLSAQLTDVSGNIGEDSVNIDLTLDTIAPNAPSNPVTAAAAADGIITRVEMDTGVEVNVDLTGTNAKVGDWVEVLLNGESITTDTYSYSLYLTQLPFERSGTLDTREATGTIGKMRAQQLLWMMDGRWPSSLYTGHTITADEITANHALITILPSHPSWGADGVKTLNARITDEAGNVGSAGGNIGVTLDTLAPNAPTNDLRVAAAVDGVISNAEKLAGVSVDVILAGTNPVIGDSVEILLNGSPFVTPIIRTLSADDISTGHALLTIASDAGWGTDGFNKILSARFIDAVGNVGNAGGGIKVALNAFSNHLALVVDAFDAFPKELSLSFNGRYVAFSSHASLVSGDANGYGNSDIFIVDTETGGITRASNAADGTAGNSWSYSPSLSSDGRYVAFSSRASNLVPGDTSDTDDFFVKDTQTGTITRVGTGAGYGQLANLSLSPDGRYVAFSSYHWYVNLDIYIQDTQTGSIIAGSTKANGAFSNTNHYCLDPSLSSDGRYVAFSSNVTDLILNDNNMAYDIFVKDIQTGAITLVSTATDGSQGNDASGAPAFSSDGRYVVFLSSASNLVSGDTNGKTDVFIKDLQTGVINRISIAADGAQGNNNSGVLDGQGYNQYMHRPSISSDGRYVLFSSDASNLVPGDTNNTTDFFVKDTQTGAIIRVNTDADGTNLYGVWQGSISADGRHVALATRDSIYTANIGDWIESLSLTQPAPPANSPFILAAEDGIISNAEKAAGVVVDFELAGTNAIAGDSVEILLNGNPFATPMAQILTSGDITMTGLARITIASNAGWGADGEKIFNARVIDAEGNVKAVSGNTGVTLDTVAPSAPTNALVVAAATDGIITDAEKSSGVSVDVSLAGTHAVAGDSVEILLNGNPFTADAVTHGLTSNEITDGHATLTIASDAGWGNVGNKTLSARITDIAGNVGAASASLAMTLVLSDEVIFDSHGGQSLGLVGTMANYAKAAYSLGYWEDDGDNAKINDLADSGGAGRDAKDVLAELSREWTPIDLNVTMSQTSYLKQERVNWNGWDFLDSLADPLVNLDVSTYWQDTPYETQDPGYVYAEIHNDFETGLYTYRNSAALVMRCGDAAVIAFRGTNDNREETADSGTVNGNDPDNHYRPDVGQWNSMEDHWDQFAPLVQAFNNYVNDNEITKVYVTGHSLGGAMAEAFMASHPNDDKFQAITFAGAPYSINPLVAHDNRITNIEIQDDPVPAVLGSYNTGDELYFIGSQTMNGDADNHSMEYYRDIAWDVDNDTWASLLAEAGETNILLAGSRSVQSRAEDFVVATGNDTLDMNTLQNALDDRLIVNRDIDYLYGGAGNDVLYGDNPAVGWSNDIIIGGSGNDIIDGRNGDDILVGGLDADTLNGGSGKDLFVYNSFLESGDTITDFSLADDHLVLNAINFGFDLVDPPVGSYGTLAAGNFALNAPVDTNDYLVFNETSHVLSYYAQGGESLVSYQLATLQGIVAMDASHILLSSNAIV